MNVKELARQAKPSPNLIWEDADLERFAELVRQDLIAMYKQALTDPENQPSQYGTVTIEYMEQQIALAAARELQALKPVAYMDSKGVLFNDTTHPHLHTALYALDKVTK